MPCRLLKISATFDTVQLLERLIRACLSNRCGFGLTQIVRWSDNLKGDSH